MIKSISFIVLTQFFNFNELKKLNQQYFFIVLAFCDFSHWR